ncbi:hypothetical protein ACOME3_007887 [Neoechinorhynchus agilis]
MGERPLVNLRDMSPKAKVLFLHGYQQNTEIFRTKTGYLRKTLKSVIESCDFLDGTYSLQDGTKAWWSTEGLCHESEVIAGVSAFKKKWTNDGPFDGILAFSQGAAFLVYLLTFDMG